ncbi:MAG: phosphate-starvation-inducible PsiE family protein [Caldimicrobium sp.]
MMSLQEKFLKFYNLAIKITYNITIIILIVVLAFILYRIFQDLGNLFIERTVRLGIKDLVTSVLTLIVVLELVRAFVEFFEHHRLRMEILLEVLIAFSIREFMILVFQGNLKGLDVLYWTLGIFMLVLGRSLAILIKPGKEVLFKSVIKKTKRKIPFSRIYKNES